MKTCNRCRIDKDESEFSKRSASAGGGLQVWCKTCFREYSREHVKREGVRERKNEQANTYAKARYAVDEDFRNRKKAASRESKERMGKAAVSLTNRRNRLKREYGLSLE